MTSKTKPTDPYAKAGVNIEKGNEPVSYTHLTLPTILLV